MINFPEQWPDASLGRRGFLVRTGLLLGLSALPETRNRVHTADDMPSMGWADIRKQFNLSPEYTHMASFFLASHPKRVREAIEKHRVGLDADPLSYFFENEEKVEAEVLRSAAEYLGVRPDEIALTDSTTMGLGLLYGSLTLEPGQEILTTTHDHYSTEMSLQHRAQRTGAVVKRVSLYQQPSSALVSEIVDSMMNAITPKTRIVAVTWVHSSTGVRLPIRAMADALKSVNAGRSEKSRVLLSVDGVHGLGVENVTLPELGCDFFVAGTHKWMFGPRGTGLVWGRSDAWPIANAIIPTFNLDAYEIWMKVKPPQDIPVGAIMTPGGFHSFDHRWALNEAFGFHMQIGKQRIASRIHELNRRMKEELSQMPHIKLHTPLSDDLSAGIICFDVKDKKPLEVVEGLYKRKIVASITPYATQYVRLAPSLVTLEDDVDKTLKEVRALA